MKQHSVLGSKSLPVDIVRSNVLESFSLASLP